MRRSGRGFIHRARRLPQPDRVIYLTASEKLAKSRSDFGTERYEKAAFQKRVSERFAEISKMDPNLEWVQYEVVGIGGCAQQHGTVYTAHSFISTLSTLDAAQPILPQLGGLFVVPNSPIWMDGSTEELCKVKHNGSVVVMLCGSHLTLCEGSVDQLTN
eukprot:sb/3472963/